MNQTDREQHLRSHLDSYGIRHFQSDDYWAWGGEMLGERLGSELNRLRQPLVDGSPTPAQVRRFYDFTAQPRVARVVHSMKADAILRSGLFVESQLPESGTILDVGCSIGYLTTFYAVRSPGRVVHGWDWSRRSVEHAQQRARRAGISNVFFSQEDISRHVAEADFDVVCSTQTVGGSEAGRSALTGVANCLGRGGIFVSVEPIKRAEDAEEFVLAAACCNLALRHHEFVFYCDLGEKGGYPAFVFEKKGEAIDFNLAASYEQAVVTLSE